jgi:hypothetical protein
MSTTTKNNNNNNNNNNFLKGELFEVFFLKKGLFLAFLDTHD